VRGILAPPESFVLQCVAVRRGVFQCDTVCCSVLQYVAVRCNVLQCDAACWRGYRERGILGPPDLCVLQCVAVCCSVLQCVAVCCSEMQSVAENAGHSL